MARLGSRYRLFSSRLRRRSALTSFIGLYRSGTPLVRCEIGLLRLCSLPASRTMLLCGSGFLACGPMFLCKRRFLCGGAAITSVLHDGGSIAERRYLHSVHRRDEAAKRPVRMDSSQDYVVKDSGSMAYER
jgi:hypothetical protein